MAPVTELTSPVLLQLVVCAGNSLHCGIFSLSIRRCDVMSQIMILLGEIEKNILSSWHVLYGLFIVNLRTSVFFT